MIRKAFTMKLKPGGLAQYRAHHDAIWQELVAEIQAQGIAEITIFEADPVLPLTMMNRPVSFVLLLNQGHIPRKFDHNMALFVRILQVEVKYTFISL